MHLLNIADFTFLDMGGLGRQWTWVVGQHDIVLYAGYDLAASKWRTGFLIDSLVIYEREGQYDPHSEWAQISYLLLERNILCAPLTSEAELPFPTSSLESKFD